MNEPLYDFVEEKNVPTFKRKAVKEYEASLNADWDNHKIVFDPDYLEYLKEAHGRRLRNCWFHDYRGKARRIDRIFSFVEEDDLKGPPQESWRPGSEDIRLDYSVHSLEGLMSNWEEDDFLVPFAGVEMEEMAEYDMLCLHYQFIPRPVVVLWEHEEGAAGSNPVHFIAKDFKEFIKLVFAK
jgi:hypothetical protein